MMNRAWKNPQGFACRAAPGLDRPSPPGEMSIRWAELDRKRAQSLRTGAVVSHASSISSHPCARIPCQVSPALGNFSASDSLNRRAAATIAASSGKASRVAAFKGVSYIPAARPSWPMKASSARLIGACAEGIAARRVAMPWMCPDASR